MSAIVLTATQRAALVELRELLPDVNIALVGAGALAHHVPLARETKDIDLVIAIDVGDFRSIAEERLGWTRHDKREHEWTTPHGDFIDVLPVGGNELPQALRWQSGHEMNLTGLRHALNAKSLVDDTRIRIPSVAALALLKMVAYLDRTDERTRDLQDLATILHAHPPTDDDMFFADDVLQSALVEHEARAWMLGRDVAAIVDDAERALVRVFFDRMLADGVDTTRFVANSPWRYRPEEALVRLSLVARWFRPDEPDIP